MDYGQNSQKGAIPEFFTSGAGTNLENENSFESENNLDLTNTANNWDLPMPDRDQRAMGNRAIASAESLNFSNETTPPKEAAPTSIDNIANNPPTEQPSPNPAAMQPPATTEETPRFEKAHIKTDDRLSDTAVAAIDQAKAKLDQDGDIASFYNTARDMMEVNLENSYNRKLAA